VSEKVALTARLPIQLHKSMRVWAAQNDMDLNAAINTACARLVAVPTGAHGSNCPLASATEEERTDATRLLALLRSGDASSISIIRGALKAWKD
jgi:hypothetical protein